MSKSLGHQIANLAVGKSLTVSLNDEMDNLPKTITSSADFVVQSLYQFLGYIQNNVLNYTSGLQNNHSILVHTERDLILKRISPTEFQISMRISDILAGANVNGYLSQDVWCYLHTVKRGNFYEPYIDVLSFNTPAPPSIEPDNYYPEYDLSVSQTEKFETKKSQHKCRWLWDGVLWICANVMSSYDILRLLEQCDEKNEKLYSEYNRHYNRYFSPELYLLYAENWRKRHALYHQLLAIKNKLEKNTTNSLFLPTPNNNWALTNFGMSWSIFDVDEVIDILRENLNYKNKKTGAFMLRLLSMAQVQKQCFQTTGWKVDGGNFNFVLLFEKNKLIVKVPFLWWFASNSIKNAQSAIVSGIFDVCEKTKNDFSECCNFENKALEFHFDFGKNGLTYSFTDEDTHKLLKDINADVNVVDVIKYSVPEKYRSLLWQYIVGHLIEIANDEKLSSKPISERKSKEKTPVQKFLKAQYIHDLHRLGKLCYANLDYYKIPNINDVQADLKELWNFKLI